jgi:type VI secretion system secreted protein VgrG
MEHARAGRRRHPSSDRAADGPAAHTHTTAATATRTGTPLDSATRTALEAGLGHDFSELRIHSGAEANELASELEATAFTTGTDVYFGQGAPDPTTPAGLHLLAHEATHVVQQRNAPSAADPSTLRDPIALDVSRPDDPAEAAASQAAALTMQGLDASGIAAGIETPANAGTMSVQRWPSFDWLTDAASGALQGGAAVLDALNPFGGSSSAPSAPLAPQPVGAGTGGGAGGGAPGTAKAPDPKAVQGAVASLDKAMSGWGTDEDAIYAALRGKSPAEIAAIKTEYQKRTGSSLDAALADEMSGTELAEAKAWLSGNQASGAAAALQNASSGWGTDEAKITSTLNNLSPDDYLAMRADFAKRSGGSVSDMLKDELSGGDLKTAEAALVGKFGTGLGSKDVDALSKKSPTLMKNLDALADQGWVIEYGKPGDITATDHGAKKIVVNPAEKGITTELMQTLSHESGHALHETGYTPHDGLTKAEFVEANLQRQLAGEGEATIMNLRVRDEILKAKGSDIGVAGGKAEEYKKLYAKYSDPKDHAKLREEIGKIYRKGEFVAGGDYEKYYSDFYKGEYDRLTKKP